MPSPRPFAPRASSHASWSIDVSLFDQRVAAVGGAAEAMERCAEALAATAAEAPLRALDVTLCPDALGTNASSLCANVSSGDVFLRALAVARPALDALGVKGSVGGGGGCGDSLAALLSPSLRRFSLDLSAVPSSGEEGAESEENNESGESGGGGALASLLRGLRRIALDGNEALDDEAARGLLEALVKMPAIEFVALSGSVPASAAASLEYAALRRRGVAVHI